MSVDRVAAVANAILYEGYNLYPYRPSSVKNRRRFNFGVVAPQEAVERADQGYAWHTRAECLVEGDAATTVIVTVRFLQLTPRPAGAGDEVAAEPWLDATERSVTMPGVRLGDVAATGGTPHTAFSIDGLSGYAELSAHALATGGFRVRVSVANTTPLPADAPLAHNDLLPVAFVSAHSILSVSGGLFVSLLDPPDRWRDAAAACTNTGVWPVLAGDAGRRDVMLASPIILYDYPEVAPDSPGDLFDAAEIDEILTLRIMTLTDGEKDEMRRADERTRQLLERTEALTPEHLMKLHGVMRAARANESGG